MYLPCPLHDQEYISKTSAFRSVGLEIRKEWMSHSTFWTLKSPRTMIFEHGDCTVMIQASGGPDTPQMNRNNISYLMRAMPVKVFVKDGRSPRVSQAALPVEWMMMTLKVAFQELSNRVLIHS